MRLFTFHIIFTLLLCFPALGQTVNNFEQPTQVISDIQSAELQVALDIFNQQAQEIPVVYQAATFESRLNFISSISSGNWNDPSSWSCACIPTASDNVTIQLGHTINVTGAAETKNLAITEGGILSLEGVYGTIFSIYGDVSSAGILKSGQMRVALSGDATQTITGALECYDLWMPQGNLVNLDGSIRVRHHVELSNGVLDVSNGELRLTSSDFGPASIIVNLNASYIGLVTREIEVSCLEESIKRIGFGMSGVTVAELIGDIPTSGFVGSDNPSASISNILSWNEATFQMNQIQSVDDVLEPGVGYSIALPAGNYLIDFKGTLQPYDAVLPVFRSNPIAFNLVSNPTQAYIDLGLLFDNMVGLEKSINIWDNSTKNYDSYASMFGLNGQTQFLAPGATFWIRAFDAPSAQLNEEMHVSSTTAESDAQNSNSQVAYMRWVLESDGSYDEIVIAIDDSSTTLFDNILDANNWKGNQRCDLMSAPENHNAASPFYSIQFLPALAGEKNATVGLGISTQVEAQTTKNFTLRLIEYNMGDYCAWITTEGESGGFPLAEGLTLGLSISGGATTMGSITNDIRWNIHISPPSEVESVSPGCNGEGEASITILGSGSGPWDFALNDSDGNLINTLTGLNGPGVFAPLNSGDYTVVLSNQGEYGCGVNSHPASVIAPESMMLDIESTVYCEDALDAQATVYVQGGDSPYTYQWSNGETTPIASSLKDGFYDVIVTDAYGCLDTIGVDIISAPSIDLTVVSPGCEGNGVTSITVNGSGNEVWTFTYYTENGDEIAHFQDGTGEAVLTNLPSGTYTVVATEGGHWGCPPREESAEVIAPAQLDLGLDISHIGCDGISDGAIDFNVTGGTEPYEYIWSTGESGGAITNLSSGEYTAIAIDAFGCSDTATVEIIAAPQVIAEFQTPILPLTSGDGSGYTLGFINTSEGATGYSWFFGDNSDPSFDIHAVHTYLSPGTYDVFLNAWNNFCSNTIRQVITIDAEETVSDGGSTGGPPTEVFERNFEIEQNPFYDIENPIATRNGWKLELGTEYEHCEVRAYDLSGRAVTSVFKPEIDGVIHMEADVWPTIVLIRLTDPLNGAVKTWKMVK
ncbi:MAG: hypothetical protein COA49_08950 [Bacteroidetes bacterium]|nr:MAG: hypothetical protein COA49_08950 [Bacteroidota bacterium]